MPGRRSTTAAEWFSPPAASSGPAREWEPCSFRLLFRRTVRRRGLDYRLGRAGTWFLKTGWFGGHFLPRGNVGGGGRLAQLQSPNVGDDGPAVPRRDLR